jgi:hypothetical protein
MPAMARREQARDDEDLDDGAVDDLDDMSSWLDDLTPEQEAAVDAELEERSAEIRAGGGIPHEEAMRRLNERRRAATGSR